jgi:hypothetical protein
MLRERYACDEASAKALRDTSASNAWQPGSSPTIARLSWSISAMGAVRVVVHSVYGGRVNAPWGWPLRSGCAVSYRLPPADER